MTGSRIFQGIFTDRQASYLFLKQISAVKYQIKRKMGMGSIYKIDSPCNTYTYYKQGSG